MPASMLSSSVSVLLLASSLLAVGCGTTHSTAPERPVRTAPPASGQYPPGFGMPNPGAPQAPGAGQAAQFVAQLGQAWSAVRTLSGTYELTEKKGSETETAKVKMFLKKPGQYRLEVATSSSTIKNGSTSVFDTKTRKISSRLAGALSFVPINGTLDDARTKSVRGWSLDQTDYVKQTEVFLIPGAAVTLLPGGTGPTLEIARPTQWPGIEAIRITLDPTKMVPVAFEMTERGQVVYKRRFSGVQVNPSIAADKFKL